MNNASRGRLIFGIVDKTGEVVGVADPDGDDKLTNAGALLADYCPIYQSRLFCTRWNGLTKASGLQDAFDDAEYVTFFFFVDALLIVLYRVSINLPMVIFIFNFPRCK